MEGGFNDRRIELGSGVPPEFVERVLNRLRFLIDPVTHHGIECVRYGEDTSELGNPVAGAAERIAQSIEAFVVAKHGTSDLGVDQAGDHLEAKERMAPHQCRFLGVECAREVEDVGVDGGLADVMKHCGDLEASDSLRIKSEGVGDGAGQRTDTPPVIGPLRSHHSQQVPNWH